MDADLATPTARALRTLELIQLHPGIGADEIARRLRSTDRAVRRWVSTLRDAGVPIESEPGRYGGYRLGRGHRPPPLVFTAGEAMGLVMAVLDGHHAAADDRDPVGAALGKLVAVLPESVARHAAAVRRHARAAPDRAAVRPDPSTTSAVADAVARRQRVGIGYRPRSGRLRTLDVDPWALVVRHGRWYLLGHSASADAPRALRVDRIVEPVRERGSIVVEPPPDFDPVTWLERHLGTGWRYRTHVVFDAPIDEVRRWVGPSMGELSSIDAHTCELVGTTDNPPMYAGERLAAIPHPFRVVGGPELVESVAALATRLRAATP